MFRQLPLLSSSVVSSSSRPSTSPWARAGVIGLAAASAIAIGILLGLFATAAAVRTDGIGAARAGPWRILTDAGGPGINPYARARQAHTGEIPLATAQGLSAKARQDSLGAALDAHCSYRVSGALPPTQFWTLEATDTAGRPFDNPAGRQSFTSAGVLRDSAGRFAVVASPSAQPGNWLPLPGIGRFILVLRLYETAGSSGGAASGSEAGWPSIERLGCS